MNKLSFIKISGVRDYIDIMYNDVKESDTKNIQVAYSGKDIKKVLDYFYEQEQRIDKAIEYINDNSTNTYLLKSFDIDVLLEILGGKE